MDASPLVNQLVKLQQVKQTLQIELANQGKNKVEQDELIELENLSAFRRTLRNLLESSERNPVLQAAIIKKVVHKVIVQTNGFEIHFHGGSSYFKRELGKKPGSRIYLFGTANSDVSAHTNDFFKSRRSTLLTNGDLTPT